MRRRSELAREAHEGAYEGAHHTELAVSPERGRLGALGAHKVDDTTSGSVRTLKTRAVYYLSKRDYSRAELSKKLSSPSFKARQRAFVNKTPLPEAPSVEVVEDVLNDLQRQGFLNDARFAANTAQQQAKRLGNARVLFALSQHQLDATVLAEITQTLKDTELARCYDVWTKKFASSLYAAECSEEDKSDTPDYATLQAQRGKQARFLLQRGFNGEVVKKIINGWQPDLSAAN